MPGEAIKRLDANTQAALDRSLGRFKDSLRDEYDRMFGSKAVSLEERGKEYLTIAGDVDGLRAWYQSQEAIHGSPIARTMFSKFIADGERFIDKMIADEGIDVA